MPQNIDELEKHVTNAQYLDAMIALRDIYTRNRCTTTLELLQKIGTMSVIDGMKKEEDKVLLSTIHASKGLQWSCVIIAGMNVDDFPSPRSIREGNIEEERRIAYVAMTRSEDALYLVNTANTHRNNNESIFLTEIKGENDVWSTQNDAGTVRAAPEEDNLQF